MESGFELIDHTADAGVRVWSATLEGLVPAASAGLYALIGDLRPGAHQGERCVAAVGGDEAELLREFLAELLYWFESDQIMLILPEVEEFGASRLRVRGVTAKVDAAASVFLREVKAITYHELMVQRTSTGWEACYIVDL